MLDCDSDAQEPGALPLVGGEGGELGVDLPASIPKCLGDFSKSFCSNKGEASVFLSLNWKNHFLPASLPEVEG